MKSTRNQPFMGNVGRLRGRFDSAHSFLMNVSHDRVPDFYMGTSVNANLYYKDGFYSYLTLGAGELTFWPEKRTSLKRNAKKDYSGIFSLRLGEMIVDLRGFRSGWAERTKDHLDHDGVILRTATPGGFFNELLAGIRTLHEADRESAAGTTRDG